MRVSDFRKSNNVELNFEKTVKLAEIANTPVTITATTTITTAYGVKNVAVFDDGRMVYLTIGLEGLMEETLPYTTEFFMKKSKLNKEYWAYKRQNTEFMKLKDIPEGTDLTIISAKPLKTKYGEKVLIEFAEISDTFITQEYWALKPEVQDIFANDECISCHVVKRISKKTGNEYYTLED